MKTIKKLFYIQLFLLFVSCIPIEKDRIVLSRYIYYNVPSRYFDYIVLIDIVLIIIWILFFISLIRKIMLKGEKIKFNLIDILFIFLVFYRIISLIFFCKYSIKLSLFREFSILIIYILLKWFYDGKLIYKTIICSGIYNSICVIIQFIIYQNRYHGNVFQNIRYMRFPGGFLDPVVLSIFFMYCLITFSNNEKKFNAFFYHIIIALILVASFFTGSRGFWVILVFFILLDFIYFIVKNRVIKLKLSYIFLCILLVTGAVANIERIKSIFNNYNEYVFASQSSIASTNARADMGNKAVTLFKDNFFIGVGTNNYSYYAFYLDEGDSNNQSNSHNVYLTLLSENGIIGFGLYLSIIIYIMIHTVIVKRNFSFFKEILLWIISGCYIGMLTDFTGYLIFIFLLHSIYQSNVIKEF